MKKANPLDSCAATVSYCRIQVRLDRDSRQRLDAYRAENGDLSISEAIRRLCRAARSMTRAIASTSGRRLTASQVSPAAIHEDGPTREGVCAWVPLERRPLRRGRAPGEGFTKFFFDPSDIGVRLDREAWDGLSWYREWRGLSVSEAVRELCMRSGKRGRPVIATAGRRISAGG